MDLKITKQVEELEKHAAENARQIGAMKAFMKLNFGGEHTDKLPKLLDGSEKTPLEMLHKIGLHLARMCEGMAHPTSENSLHKHVVSGSLLVPEKSEKWLRKYIVSKLEKDNYNKEEITKMLAYVFEQAYKQANSNDR
jgi:hypothetical protein